MLLVGSRPLPPPPVHMGGGGTLTHRENVGAGAHVLPAESGQQLNQGQNIFIGLLKGVSLLWPGLCTLCSGQSWRDDFHKVQWYTVGSNLVCTVCVRSIHRRYRFVSATVVSKVSK
jgi:hypothetical protein